MRPFIPFLFLLLSAAPAMAEADNLEIIKVTPDGNDVPAAEQIVIQFNQPVVPIGPMERTAAEIPVTTTPAIACDWRWLNPSALACNVPSKQPLQLSTRYTMQIKPGIKTEAGKTIAKPYQHSFTTQRPQIVNQEFVVWKSAGQPTLRVDFNQPVEQASVAQHVFFAAGDKKTRVAVKATPDPRDTTPAVGKNARAAWLIEPVQELPLDTHIVLKTEAGLISALGAEASVDSNDVVAFDTYPDFTFMGVKCTDNNGKELLIAAGSTSAEKCNPLQIVHLSFSAPVERSKIGPLLNFTPPVGKWVPAPWSEDATPEEAPPEAEAEATPEVDTAQISEAFKQPHEKGKTYDIWVPGGLKAAQQYTVQMQAATVPTSHITERLWHWLQSWFITVPPAAAPANQLQDIFGRSLRNTVSATFATDHRAPNFVLDYNDAVLEKGIDSEVPLFVTNLDSYTFNYSRLTANGFEANQTFRHAIPAVKDIQFSVPFGVRQMLNGGTGAIFGTLQTQPSLDRPNVRLFAQVTPYQVHLKLGHFSTIAWVTDMATGAPVSGAKVSLYQDAFTTLHNPKNITTQATTDAAGIVLLPGTDTLDPKLEMSHSYADEAKRYFLRVEKDGDMALLPVSDAFIIDSYRASGSDGDSVNTVTKERYGHMRAWGTTAQGIYRAGDTMQYKIYVRNQDNKGFIAAPKKGYQLKIIDAMGKVVHEVKDVTLSDFGGVSGEFTLPKEAAVGWYQFKLTADFAQQASSDESDPEVSEQPAAEGVTPKKYWLPMRVLVSDFTPSPFKVTNQLNGDLFRSNEQIEVTTHAQLHAGGAYTDASTRITAMLDSAPFVSKHPLTKDFAFDSYQNETSSQQLFQNIDKVNNKGELALKFSTGTPNVVYGKLLVESAVADDRGKYVTGQARADYVGVNRLVGLRSKQWVHNVGKPATIDYVVVDEHGTPATGTKVDIKLEHEVTTAARVKGAGNSYLTEYNTDWVEAGACNSTSTQTPLACTFTPTKAGNYRATANITDTKGNAHTTTTSAYAVGKDFVMWDNGSDSSLTIVPEATNYKVGDTARYLVKNPYPGAKALITIERYGVLDHFVQTLDGSTPVVEFKIKPQYLPGFYLSVVVVSPRADKPLGEGQVDLGKPTYRMGYVTVPVKDPHNEMVITAKTDRAVYKPRDKVTVSLHAEPRTKDKKEPTELTVVVLDESVFDMIAGGKNYFNPYTGFYKLESLDLRNYSLLTRLIGRQRFELKGANPGGDGGADLAMRSVFKFVSYWNASLTTDKNGNATATFDAPDNLTGWRILAIANTPTDRFGLGDANFKVNRPTEVRPVMPNQVLEGDAFDAGFSIMNRTDKERTLNVRIEAEGNVDAAKTPTQFNTKVTLAPYKRTTVLMPIQANTIAQAADVLGDTPVGQVRFSITAGDDTDTDSMTQNVPVHTQASFNVSANYGTTTSDKATESVQFPPQMLPNMGGLQVIASPTVIGNVSGAFQYMRDYPYMCWEQKISKGVMAAHYKTLKAYVPNSLQWAGSEALPQETLNQAASFQAPNGGMTYFVAQDAYVDPYLSAYTAVAFNWLHKAGYNVPQPVEDKLHAYLGNLLKNDVAPSFYSQGMTASVRAVALAALAERGKATLADLQRYQPHVKNMALFGQSYFLQAALAIKGGEPYVPSVAKMMLASSNETSGTFTLKQAQDTEAARMLASPVRDNCAALDAFRTYSERDEGKKLLGDIPFKLVRSITQNRQNRAHWSNTQENMFCTNALINFARVYEKDQPNMRVQAAIDGEPFGNAAFSSMLDPAVTLNRPAQANDAGRKATIDIERNGTGRLYYQTNLTYALPNNLSVAANAGLEIHREYSVERAGKWQLLPANAQVKRGELVRVDLYVSAPADRNFVVVNDAVPGGLEPVNRDIANASVIDANKGDFAAADGAYWGRFTDWVGFGANRWSFYHQEIRHNAVRFYADYLPAGNYHLSYAAQAIATGSFNALPAIAEEMYHPDVYGKTVGLELNIQESEIKP